MIAVDTNVIAYILLDGPHTAAMRDVFSADGEWAAPTIWRSEFRNVLSTYLRANRVTLAEAIALMSAADAFVAGREHLGDSRDILTLAARSGHSAYDCEFVAVAKGLGVPLITNDRKLCRSFPETAVSPSEFLAGR